MPLPPGLYAIADAGFGDPVALGLTAARAGVAVVQLRAKGWSPSEVERAARALLPELSARGCVLVINDHVEVAAHVGAPAVHLGQEDGPSTLAEARALLPAGALIGRSTRTLEQVAAAQDADYIGFGPVFATSTREGSPAPRGVELLRQAVARSTVPVVAIGGISAENVGDVRASGAHGWAVISALWRHPDLDTAISALR